MRNIIKALVGNKAKNVAKTKAKKPKKGVGKKGITGGALFNQQGVSKKGKSRQGEDSDVLAADSPTRKIAEKLEKRSIVSEPNYPKMNEVGTRGETVTQGGGTSVMQAIRQRSLINEKATQDAIKAQERINKRLDELKAKKKDSLDKLKVKFKDSITDENVKPARRIMNASRIQKEIDVQKDLLETEINAQKNLLEQAQNKERSSSGKSKNSPRIPVADYNKGGRVGKTLKSVSSKISKPLGCGKAQRGFGKGPYKK